MKYEMLFSIISLIISGTITWVFAESDFTSYDLDVSYGSTGGRYVVEYFEGEQIVSQPLTEHICKM